MPAQSKFSMASLKLEKSPLVPPTVKVPDTDTPNDCDGPSSFEGTASVKAFGSLVLADMLAHPPV